MAIDNVIDQLLRDEGGIKNRAYKDSLGFWTIGVGHKLTGSDLADPGILLWTDEQSMAQLAEDVRTAQLHLTDKLPWVWDMDVVRRGVIVNMCFNMGIGDAKHGLLSFHRALTMAEAGNYVGCSGAMLESKWAVQVGDRAHRLARQIEIGVWQ